MQWDFKLCKACSRRRSMVVCISTSQFWDNQVLHFGFAARNFQGHSRVKNFFCKVSRKFWIQNSGKKSTPLFMTHILCPSKKESPKIIPQRFHPQQRFPTSTPKKIPQTMQCPKSVWFHLITTHSVSKVQICTFSSHVLMMMMTTTTTATNNNFKNKIYE